MTQEKYDLIPGKSLLEILQEIQPDISSYSAHVWVNDDYIFPEFWPTTYPVPGSSITIRVIPQKKAARIIGMVLIAIAVIAVSILTYGILTGPAIGMGSTLAGMISSFAGMAVGIVGNLILNALIPPTTASSAKQAALAGVSGAAASSLAESPTLSITGASNQANKWGPIPVVLGRHKVFPVYGAETYSEIVGADQYLNIYFVWSRSHVMVEDIKIKDTPLENYTYVQTQHVNLTYDGVVYGTWTPTLYTNDIHEVQESILLEQGISETRVALEGADKIILDFVCPNGLYAIDTYGTIYSPGKKYDKTVTLQVEFYSVTLPYYFTTNVTMNASTSVAYRYAYEFANWPDCQTYIRVTRITADDDNSYTYDQLDNCQSTTYWSATRSVNYTTPFKLDGCAVTIMRIKASNELSGTVDQLSGIVTSVCPDYDSTTDTWITQATNNPASLYVWAVTGTHKAAPWTSSRIDLANLAHWHIHCAYHGWTYNKVIDYKASMSEILDEIAAGGRAARSWVDNKLGVIMDEPQEFAIGPCLTPKNIRDFSSTIAYPDLPHCFRVPFRNEQNDYIEDEMYVLADGYSVLSPQGTRINAWGNWAPELPLATKYEQLELAGQTNPDNVFKLARYHLACAMERFETHTFDMPLLQLVATRGDRVKLAHDAMLVGVSWGRVKSLDMEVTSYTYGAPGPDSGELLLNSGGNLLLTSGGNILLTSPLTPVYGPNMVGVTLDESCPMEAGTDYCIRFGLEDNTTFLATVVTDPGDPYSLTFTTPRVPTDPCPAVGDVYMFGENERESLDLIIKSITPKSDLSATVTAVLYSESIYTADSGVIPPYDPLITLSPALWPPIIENVRSDGTVMVLIANAWQPRILVDFSRASGKYADIVSVEAQYREWGSLVTNSVPVVPAESQEIYLLPVTAGTTYEIHLRYVMRNSTTSRWSEWYSHTVVGPTFLPDITGLTSIYRNNQTVLLWDYITDYPGVSYELRRGGVWATAEILGYVTTNEYTVSGNGTYWVNGYSGYAISETPVSVIISGAVLSANVVATSDEFALGWSGTRVDVDADISGNLILGQTDGMVDALTDWDSDDMIDTLPAPYISQGTYTSTNTVDLGMDCTCSLSYDLIMQAMCDLLTVDSDEFWDSDQYVDGAASELVNLHVQLNVYKSGGWLGWQNFNPGTYVGQQFVPRLILTSSDPETTPLISAFSWTVDMPDRLDTMSISVPAIGAAVVFSPAFQVSPKLSIQIIGASEGDTAVITSLDETGFDIQILNGGSGVERTDVHVYANAY
jgi:hypothetical protein